MKRIVCLLLFNMLLICSVAQEDSFISIRVLNENNEPMAAATIVVDDGRHIGASDIDGYFRIPLKGKDSLKIAVTFVGYGKIEKIIGASDPGRLVIITLEPLIGLLEGVTVVNNFIDQRKREEMLPLEIADRSLITINRGGSLVSSISSIPGISAMEIGSGHSKPLIRGLGFNRVVVTENGIRHEAQQWGSDHGLEIDQFAVESVEILKGPAAVKYGSDAIGGVIRIQHDPVPASGALAGNLEVSGKSNNNLLGGSAYLAGRGENMFFTSRFTMLDYADYRIPADSVEIYSFLVPLHKRRLRNTAGTEMNMHASAGIIKPGFFARLSASHVSSNSGFFANAHGLEPRRVDTELYDRSDRDILFPSQDVRHFKLAGQTRIEHGLYRLEAELGYQNNFRQEKNHYVNHGYMPAIFPESMGAPSYMEREFRKDIFSFNLRNFLQVGNKHEVSLGMNAEYQDNRIGGYAFIIPEFRQLRLGIYLYDRITLNDRTTLHAGARFDRGSVRTEEYRDWFPTPVPDEDGSGVEEAFLLRAEAIDRKFSSPSMSLGIYYRGDIVSLKASIGNGFRIPTPKELAANGVNYHYFRYEKGDSSLEAENSWQLDFSLGYGSENVNFQISPFLNYFPGYIYLDPSYRHDYMYGAGNQIFQYTRNEVVRFGGEIRFSWMPARNVTTELTGDYVYSEQLSGNKKGFTIPFSPPPSVRLNLKYSPDGKGILNSPFGGIELGVTGRQNRIVPPERPTPGYQLVHIYLGGSLSVNRQRIDLNFRIHNLLNKRYLNHVSFYRLIGAPEAGRNFILSVNIPFGGRQDL